MDTFSHIALGALCCSRSGLPALVRRDFRYSRKFDWTVYAAGAFAAIPDLSSFGAYMVQRLWNGTFQAGAPALAEIPAYVHWNYNMTHSLVIASAVGLLLYFFCRPCFLPFLAWPLHILCDIPTHGIEFFATPFLWPIADYRFDGWSFGRYRWMIPAYWTVIFLLFAVRLFLRREKTEPSSSDVGGQDPAEG